jgi:hypothetical protein
MPDIIYLEKKKISLKVNAIDSAGSQNRPVFRWTYVVLPLVFLLVSLALTGYFYRLLPAEIVYRFQGDVPDKWINRGALIMWMNLPQVFFVMLSVVLVRLILLGARYWTPEETPVNRLLPVMGNMVALPQLVLLFVMLNLFLYNAYHIKLIPVWIIAVIILVLGGIVLGVFFVRTYRRSRRR